MEHKYIKHISTQCCYELQADGKTVEICGCRLQPTVDGILWEYTDTYTDKVIIPSDPYANHR
jgi:hypothetical protein